VGLSGVAQILVENVSKVFAEGPRGGRSVKALETITLAIEREEILCLVGPSGCGKTTLLNVIAGFEEATTGAVLLNGRPITGPGPDRSVVFQSPALFPWLTVFDNVVLGPRRRRVPRQEYEPRAHELLNAMGLQSFPTSYPYQLSGGMKQRVALARALVNRPQILLMDEPFGALDAQTRLRMQEMLLRIWEAYRPTILFVTHDVEESLFLSDRVEVMSARPGTIKTEVAVPFRKPRTYEVLATPEFGAAKQKILELIYEEVAKGEE